MFEFDDNMITKSLGKKYIDEEEEINVYSVILGKDFVQLDFEQLVTSSNGNDFWNLYLIDLNGLDNTQKLQPFLQTNPCFKFTFIPLGDNYM